MALARPASGWAPLVDRALGELFAEPSVDSALRSDASLAAPGVGRDAVAVYLDDLLFWNRRVQLTAARTAEELVDLAVADAAVLVRATSGLALENPSWIDVGSGGGAPGLVIALLGAGPVTLVEPRQKRVAFLRSVVGKLGLADVDVVRDRSDQLVTQGWDVAVSRATLAPSEWLAEGARLARSAVWVLLAKGEPPALDGWAVERDLAYRWPLTGAARRAVCYRPGGSQ